jgi:RNA polymerase sigma factor (sigma-70 family)
MSIWWLARRGWRAYINLSPLQAAPVTTQSFATDETFVALHGTIARGVEIMALRRLHDREQARDAAQETLVRVLVALREGRVPPGVPVAAFAHGVARHVIADMARVAQRRASPEALDSAEAASASPLEALVSREEIKQLRASLARLSSAERALLAAYYVKGERLVDLAASTGEPPERLRKQKSRAVARLRELLRLDWDVARHVSPAGETSTT